MIKANSADETLELLREGNRRFVEGRAQLSSQIGTESRARLATAQHPHTAILGCSDSRVPPEIVFDQGLGDLFVIRVAGNVAGPSQIGSIEFAVDKFGIGVVLVLGHSGCGAVTAALEQFGDKKADAASSNLRAILDKVRPAIQPLLESQTSPRHLIGEAVRANILRTVGDLRDGSPTLGRLADEGQIVIVGAEYSLETGYVEFL